MTIDDAKRAIKLQEYCMKHVGFDSQTSTLEADKIMGNTTQKERDEMKRIEEEIRKLSEDWGENIPRHTLYNHLQLQGHSQEKIGEWIKENLDKTLYFNESEKTYTVI